MRGSERDAVVRALLDAGADKDLANRDDGATPLLRLAAGWGSDAVVRALLGADADKNLAKNDGATPLFIAAQNGTTRSCARCSTPAPTRTSR